jgi:hypothetical protein
MIDKMDEILPPLVQFRPVVSEIHSELRRGGKVPGFSKGGQLYTWKGDLRPLGVDAFLYLGGKHGAGHKLEHFNVGKRSMDEVLADTEKVVATDPLLNAVSRVDLATDTNIPVTWYRQHLRIKFKQFGSELGEMSLDYAEMGKRKIETLYAGRRPNCLRVYDKTAEMQEQYRKAIRGLGKSDPELRKAAYLVFAGWVAANDKSIFDGIEIRPYPGQAEWLAESGYKPDFNKTLAELRSDRDPVPVAPALKKIPTFEEWAGFSSSSILTRVERQISGRGKFPDFFRDETGNVTVSTVWNRLQFGFKGKQFDPYESLVFVDSGASAAPSIPMYEIEIGPVHRRPRLRKIGAREWVLILGLRGLIAEQGLQKAYQQLNLRSEGNAKRLLDSYARYFPAEVLGPSTVRFSRRELFQQFRCSIQKQFGCAA